MMPNLANQDTATKQSEPEALRGPVWALVGPTGIGKSALALELAQRLPAQIVNCDSVQCYRGFVIGAAAPSQQEQARVAHHLVGFADAASGERVDAHLYVKRARHIIASLREKGVAPLLCGGTGLYARALRYGVADVESDPSLRREWSEAERLRPGSVFAALASRDPASAQRIGPHNPARLLRALEMVLSTGKPIADVWTHACVDTTPTTLVALDAPREWLLPRIEKRVQDMLARGFVEEVKALLDAGVDAQCPPMRAVGYREVREYLSNELTREALLPAIVARTWHYVRRQRTWLRREHDVRWLDAEALWALPEPQRLDRVEEAFLAPSALHFARHTVNESGAL